MMDLSRTYCLISIDSFGGPCGIDRLPGSPFCAEHDAEGRAALAAEVGDDLIIVPLCSVEGCDIQRDLDGRYLHPRCVFHAVEQANARSPHTLLEVSTIATVPDVVDGIITVPRCVSGQCPQPRATGHALCADHLRYIRMYGNSTHGTNLVLE